jgi:N5-(cytidine 5'-diphosphoramidyl)-L-glutamine hydrolase
MKTVGVTQRVTVVPAYGERRDCLDQSWTRFLAACGLLPLLLPNNSETALALCEAVGVAGLVFTGGNDLAEFGGDAPERDAVELTLLDWAERKQLPVLGVCRGMQAIQRHFRNALGRVEGHVARVQTVLVNGQRREVNSYHNFGARESRPPLDVWAVAEDGVIEGVRHSSRPITGIMWHPERQTPFSSADVELFQRVFGVE